MSAKGSVVGSPAESRLNKLKSCSVVLFLKRCGVEISAGATRLERSELERLSFDGLGGFSVCGQCGGDCPDMRGSSSIISPTKRRASCATKRCSHKIKSRIQSADLDPNLFRPRVHTHTHTHTHTVPACPPSVGGPFPLVYLLLFLRLWSGATAKPSYDHPRM
jgi:hypothetical protein